MGAVFEARHVALGKPVAVKLLHHRFQVSAELEERFAREARSASRIGHPGIVDVIDFGVTHDGQLFYAMELLRGQPLSELLAEAGPLPVIQVVDIGRQVCLAMAAAHRRQLVHRDLKPDNLMLVPAEDGRVQVKILDFGLAKDLEPLPEQDRLTLPGTTLGTPEYMAPEQAMGLPADSSSDIYALGVVLYEILTGKLPQAGDTPEERQANKRLQPARPIDRPEVPEALAQLIQQCLARDPAERPPSMKTLAAALEELGPHSGGSTSSSAVTAPPASGGERTPGIPVASLKDAETQRTNRGHVQTRTTLGWIVLAGLLVIAGVALALAVWPRADRRGEAVGKRAVVSRSDASGMWPTPADSMLTPRIVRPSVAPDAGLSGAARAVPGRSPFARPSRRPPGMGDGGVRHTDGMKQPPLRPVVMTTSMGVMTTVVRRVAPPDATARARALLATANRHLSARVFGAARQAFTEVARLPGFRGPGLTGLARIDYEQRRWARAARAARRAVSGGGGSRARMYLGNSLFRLGRYAEAVKVYRRVLSGRPGHAGAKRMLALSRKRLGAP